MSFVQRMHPNLYHHLGSALLATPQHCSWHSPLPSSFNFAKLGSKLVFLATTHNIPDHVTLTPQKLLESSHPSYTVHNLTSPSSSSFSCHICGNPDCTGARSCPVAQQMDSIIAQNPHARHTIAKRFGVRQIDFQSHDPTDDSVPLCSTCDHSPCACHPSPTIPNPAHPPSDVLDNPPDLLDNSQDFPTAG